MVVGPPRGRWSWAVAVGDRGQARGRGVREHLAAAGERVPLGAGGVRVHLAGVVGGAGEVEGDLRDLGGEGAEGEGSEHEGMHDGESDITDHPYTRGGTGACALKRAQWTRKKLPCQKKLIRRLVPAEKKARGFEPPGVVKLAATRCARA